MRSEHRLRFKYTKKSGFSGNLRLPNQGKRQWVLLNTGAPAGHHHDDDERSDHILMIEYVLDDYGDDDNDNDGAVGKTVTHQCGD